MGAGEARNAQCVKTRRGKGGREAAGGTGHASRKEGERGRKNKGGARESAEQAPEQAQQKAGTDGE